MKKRIVTLIISFTTLIMELLPYGAVLNFANPEGEPYRQTYSYFDLTPFGYANFAPLITAVLTCAVLLLALLQLILKAEALQKTIGILSILAFAVSVTPLFVGAYSLTGGVISVLLAVNSLIAFLRKF